MNKKLFIGYINKIDNQYYILNDNNLKFYYQKILKMLLFLYSFPNSSVYNLNSKGVSVGVLLELIYFIFGNIDKKELLYHLSYVIGYGNYNSVSLFLTHDIVINNKSKEKLLNKAKYLGFKKIYNLLYYYKSGIIFFDNIYRISRLENLDSILKKGILNRDKAKKLGFINNSYNHIQKRREKNIPNIHNYVPLFFSKYAPMLFSTKIKENINNTLLFIVNSNVLLKKNTLFTNISLAFNNISKKNIFNNLNNLNKINYSIIEQKGYHNNDVFSKYKGAEILVKDRLLIKYIKEIIYFDESKKKEIMTILKENSFNIKITYNNYENYK